MIEYNTTNIKCIVEAILFMSPKGVSLKKIERQLKGVDRDLILCAIHDLIDDYNKRNTSIEIVFDNKNIEMILKQKFSKYNVFAVGRELTKPELRTLALISINGPSVEQSKIVSKRPYNHLGVLKDLGLIEVTKKGRKNMLSVTKKFNMLFDKKSVKK